jgi:hypothetical protein
MADDGEPLVQPPLTGDELAALRQLLDERAGVTRVPKTPRIAPRIDSAAGVKTYLLPPWDAGAAVLALVRAGVAFGLVARHVPAQAAHPAMASDLTGSDWREQQYIQVRGKAEEIEPVLDGLEAGAVARLDDELQFRTLQAASAGVTHQ